MSDLINRQAAIDTIRNIIAITGTCDDEILLIDKAEAQTALMMLPSAQPEIIRCKDCRWKHGSECVRFSDVRPFPDDFCSKAELRGEEE